MAVELGPGNWMLVNASPDLSSQIEKYPDLQPHSHSPRNTPIAGVLLTNADLDHVLGLLYLREGERLHVYATDQVRSTLDRYLGLSGILDAFCGATWHQPPMTDFAPLGSGKRDETSLLYRAIELPGKRPTYAKEMPLDGTYSVGYQFMDPQTGGRLLVAPDLAGVNEGLMQALCNSDVIVLDGTFWSGDELAAMKFSARNAEQMGHVTIKDCSLELLRKLNARQKVFIHINNTNPILAAASPERTAVEAAGIIIGSDGLEFEV